LPPIARRRDRRPHRSPPDTVPSLGPFRAGHAPVVAAWVTSIDEASSWAALDRLPTAGDFERWHAEPDVVAFVWLEAERVVGYGEIWQDRDLDEAELARLVVAPDDRGRGVGRSLTRALADEARRSGFGAVWLRVRGANSRARRAYEAAGFGRATPEQEAEFNAGQPHVYVWMRDLT